MRYADKDAGDYRIHAGSLEMIAGLGHIAAVVVNRRGDRHGPPQEVFRDMALSNGHCWPTSQEALACALAEGARAVKDEQLRVASRRAQAHHHLALSMRSALAWGEAQAAV
jgi:hypothetical protein